jgi:hypothetical protein
MDLDLNIEAVVEGDDQDFEAFQQMLEMGQDPAHIQMPKEEPQEVIDLNAPASMDYVSSAEASDTEVLSSEAQVASEEAQIVLDLDAAPVNFSVEEIQQHELLSANPYEGSSSSEAEHSSARNSDARELNNMQVGMAMLPDNLDVDPGLQSLILRKTLTAKKSADGIRLWTKYFAPPGSSPLIPNAWQEFFISSLLNPIRFDWERNFLSSKAWSVILREDKMETSLSFVLPAKCPIK